MDKIFFKNKKGNIIDEIDYILEHIKDDLGTPTKSSSYRIAIGCDSKSIRNKTQYSITIVFYNDEKKDGAHIIFKSLKIPKHLIVQGKMFNQWKKEPAIDSDVKKYSEGDMGFIFNRLFIETQYVMELGLYIDEKLSGKYYRKHSPNEYDGSVPCRLPEIHLDYNRYEGKSKQNKSHSLYKVALGMLCGNGFKVLVKPDSWAASSAANAFCNKSYKLLLN